MSSLLARARADAEISKILLTDKGNPTHDEMITDQAAYHVQQAIEKALKYQTEMFGMEYKKIHNLAGLIPPLEAAGFPVSDELKSKAYIISNWEASSRYADDFFSVKSDIEDALRLYEELEAEILKRLENKEDGSESAEVLES